MSDSPTAEQLGPVELIALAFRQPNFDGSVLRELVDLVERGMIRVLDLMVVHKADDGSIEVAEFSRSRRRGRAVHRAGASRRRPDR